MLKKIIDNPCAQVVDISDEIPFTILGDWKGYWLWRDQTISKDILDIFIPYIKNHHIKILISTHHNLEGVDVDYMDWITGILIPKCMESGLFIEILIDSQHFMGSLALDLMYDLHKSQEKKEYITPQVNTIEEAKILALKFTNEH